jgi:hypothetical protein
VPYVDVSGLRTWHEVSGDGDPVVLLHGGLPGGDSWQAQQPALARAGYRVYVPHRRGHGRTPDIPGPLRYQVMADDTIGPLLVRRYWSRSRRSRSSTPSGLSVVTRIIARTASARAMRGTSSSMAAECAHLVSSR